MAIGFPQIITPRPGYLPGVHPFMSLSPFSLKMWRLVAASQVPFEKYLTSNADITSHFSASL